MDNQAHESLENWSAPTPQALSVEELDTLVTLTNAKKEQYASAKAISNKLNEEYEALEAKVLEAFVASGKKKYHVAGLGLFYTITRLTVKTPKTLEQKLAFFDYIRKTKGETFLLDKQSINHQSLQKIYKDDFEAASEAGTGAEFIIPGLEAPTADVSLGFSKERE